MTSTKSAHWLYGLKPREWLLLAAMLHLLLGITLYWLSMHHYFPQLSNGRGGWEFATDSGDTLGIAVNYAELLKHGNSGEFLSILSTLHIGTAGKVYWVAALFFGPTLLACVPVSTFLFTALLFFLYRIGTLIWNPKAGFWIALFYCAMPSMLLHSTQPLKDGPFLLGQFMLLYSMLRFLRPQNARNIILLGGVAFCGSLLGTSVRPHVQFIVLITWTLFVLILISRHMRGNRYPLLQTAVAVLLCGFMLHNTLQIFGFTKSIQKAPQPISAHFSTFVVSQAHPSVTNTATHIAAAFSIEPLPPIATEEKDSLYIHPAPDDPPVLKNGADIYSKLAHVIAKRRWEWISAAKGSTSNVDLAVEFNTPAQLAAYIPKAALIGLAAPFPPMWIEPGRRVGRVGRILSGAETFFMYFVIIGAAIALIRRRKEPEIILLLFYSALGFMFLGLFVPNIGALFRMRYSFWLALAVVGVGRIYQWASRSATEALQKTKIIRIITRMNVGGPALHTSYLTDGLDAARYETWLITGTTNAHEADYTGMSPHVRSRLIEVSCLRREVHPWDDLRALFALYRIIRRIKPDIVHTHTAKAGTLGRLAARLAGAPVIIHTYHGHVLQGYFSKRKEWCYTLIERFLASFSTCLIAVSPQVRKELLQKRVGRGIPFHVVPLGIDLQSYRDIEPHRGKLRTELGLGAATPIVAIVARLVPIKRHIDFIEAARILHQQRPDAVFLIVGDGEERGALEAQVAENHLRDTVRFLGWRRDLAQIYADSTLVALTSANEGLPVSLIEAMACGCPIAATSAGGTVDLLEDGVSGVLVPIKNPQAIAHAMLQLLNNSRLRQSLGEQARTSAFGRYEVRRLVEDIDRLYTQILTKAG